MILEKYNRTSVCSYYRTVGFTDREFSSAAHYGFTDEELDFIINYDIKYRMGRDAESEEE
jgi:hypothetical protein